MTRTNRTRMASAVAALLAASPAAADAVGDPGGISSAGWLSIALVVAITGVLFVVHKKLT